MAFGRFQIAVISPATDIVKFIKIIVTRIVRVYKAKHSIPEFLVRTCDYKIGS